MITAWTMIENAVLILGGNRGDREALLSAAVKAVSAKCTLLQKSKIYETEAWGGVAKGAFLNQVIEIKTSLKAEELLSLIQQVEKDLGRKRAEPWGDRTMDIDILYFGNKIIDTPTLKIPHPYIQDRRFVLLPLAGICPDFVHPVLGKSTLELLDQCVDQCEVRKLED